MHGGPSGEGLENAVRSDPVAGRVWMVGGGVKGVLIGAGLKRCDPCGGDVGEQDVFLVGKATDHVGKNAEWSSIETIRTRDAVH